jgi:hypothetical protein
LLGEGATEGEEEGHGEDDTVMLPLDSHVYVEHPTCHESPGLCQLPSLSWHPSHVAQQLPAGMFWKSSGHRGVPHVTGVLLTVPSLSHVNTLHPTCHVSSGWCQLPLSSWHPWHTGQHWSCGLDWKSGGHPHMGHGVLWCEMWPEGKHTNVSHPLVHVSL